MECEGSSWCVCYQNYWNDTGVIMECEGLPPAERGDFFRATAIYVDGVKASKAQMMTEVGAVVF